MIDLHSHLLPAVDDGAATDEVALGVLRRFAAQGVRTVACTPHLRASELRRGAPAPLGDRLDALAKLAPAGMTIVLGREVMLDEPGVDLAGPELSLAGSRAVLVEFPRGAIPVHSERELFRISMSGLVPLLAHPERYRGCTAAHVRAWRAAGAVMQVDAMMLLGTSQPSRVARELLREGLVDVLASDNHGDARSLADACAWLTEHEGAEQAELLTSANPERLLRDEAVAPVPPLALPQGPLARLKSWLHARGATA